jgi:hypothetical protein
MFRRLGVLVAAVVLLSAGCSQPAASHHPRSSSTPTPTAVPTPAPTLPPCATAQTATPAGGVSSSLPVLELASGLDLPDDLLVTSDGIYVGEYGSGKIDVMTGLAGGPANLLPVTIPEVEGIAFIGSTMYVSDQANDRVVTVSGSQAQSFLQLQPVANIEGVDSIFADGSTLVVPDSPHGDVLLVGTNGQVQHTLTGFLRPVGGWPLSNGDLAIPDENRAAVIEVNPTTGAETVLAGGLGEADDVVQDSTGKIYAISIDQGRLVSVSGGAAQDVVTGLGQPQGLGIDAADNPILTEYTRGRLDVVVTTFKLETPAATAPALSTGQPLCVQLTRAPGYTGPITIDPGPGYQVLQQPGAGSQGSIAPEGCAGTCQVEVRVESGSLHDTVRLSYQAAPPTPTPSATPSPRHTPTPRRSPSR